MKLTCKGCGSEKEFKTAKEAFMDGWDFPPQCPVTTCGNCPSAPLLVNPKPNASNPGKDEHPNTKK